MKAVIYARYSSDNQREESIDGQIRECKKFAEYNGITVIGEYIDRAFSAKTDHRPEFQRMIKDSYKTVFDTVIVWKLDRFSRNRYDSARYKSVLKKNGVRVISATEKISEDASGILFESILEGYAEYYSAELAEKVKRGMTDNALKAKSNGVRAPFGYYVDDTDHYQIDETLAPIVKEIFALYVDGKKVTDIVKIMAERGIKNRNYPLNYNSIYRILTNRKYIGEYKFGDVVLENGIPALIDKDTFELVQSRMTRNKKAPAMHRTEDDYLLTTKLFCGHCGAFMVGEIGTSHTSKQYRYYKCTRAKKGNCKKKAVGKDYIENQLIRVDFNKNGSFNVTDKATGKVLIEVDPRYFRPAEVDLLLGDSSKARRELGWEPKYDLQMLVKEMVEEDLKLAKKEKTLRESGYEVLIPQEV